MLSIAEKSNDVIVAEFDERHLNAAGAKRFTAELEALLAPGASLVLDFANVEFVDSTGLGALLSAVRKLGVENGTLRLCQVRKTVRSLFELVRMHKVFDIYNTREEALASLRTTETT